MNGFQRELRAHVTVRTSPTADAFWQRWIGVCEDLVRGRLGTRARRDPEAVEELVADVLGEFITRAWRAFQGSCEADLVAYLRAIVAHRDCRRARRLRQDADARHYAGTQESAEVVLGPAVGPPFLEPTQAFDDAPPPPLSREDLEFLARLAAHDLCQQDLAHELGTSPSTVSRHYKRVRARILHLQEMERDLLEAWLLRRG